MVCFPYLHDTHTQKSSATASSNKLRRGRNRLAGALLCCTAAALPHAASAQALQICAQQGLGLLVAISAELDCGDLPGNWQVLNVGDSDWAGAGTGVLSPGDLGDRVAVGLNQPAARLHVRAHRNDTDAFIVDRGRERSSDLLVTDDGDVIVGGQSGVDAQLTVNAAQDEEVFRARANGVTALFVGADRQVGVGTSQPQAALQVDGSAAQDILRLLPNASTEPALVVNSNGDVRIGTDPGSVRLAVRNEGQGVTGRFTNANDANNSATLVAQTTGGGNALLASITNPQSTATTLSVVHAGGGRAGRFLGDLTVSRDVGIGSGLTDPEVTLHVEGNDDATDILVRDSEFARTRHIATAEGSDVVLTVQARSSSNFQRAEIGTVSAHPLVLFNGPNERLVIETDGSVCIGNC